MTAEDCAAYKTFLAEIPDHWISRRRSLRHGAGWTPFASQLNITSQQTALTIVASLFSWLVAAWAAAGPMDTDLSFSSMLELYRADVAEREVPVRRVVETLDVVEHV